MKRDLRKGDNNLKVTIPMVCFLRVTFKGEFLKGVSLLQCDGDSRVMTRRQRVTEVPKKGARKV